MTKDAALSFLVELEKYMQMRALMSHEDITIQAYTQNGLNVSKIKKMIEENVDDEAISD